VARPVTTVEVLLQQIANSLVEITSLLQQDPAPQEPAAKPTPPARPAPLPNPVQRPASSRKKR
jgi:hypothetical protein